jgi:hypothetical protein
VTLKEAVLAQPSGTLTAADRDLKPPRQKE